MSQLDRYRAMFCTELWVLSRAADGAVKSPLQLRRAPESSRVAVRGQGGQRNARQANTLSNSDSDRLQIAALFAMLADVPLFPTSFLGDDLRSTDQLLGRAQHRLVGQGCQQHLPQSTVCRLGPFATPRAGEPCAEVRPFQSLLTPLNSHPQPSLTRSSTPYRISLIYLTLVILRALLNWSSSAWTNKLWRSSSLGQAIFGGPVLDWGAQIVVVTGGASGIGQILVETLATMGATVVVLDRQSCVVERGESVTMKAPGGIFLILCSLRRGRARLPVRSSRFGADFESGCSHSGRGGRPPSPSARFCPLNSLLQVGHPTVLVNNAGVVQGKLILDLSEAEVCK